MESPRKSLLVPKGNKYENDQDMCRNMYTENAKRSPVAGAKHFMAPTISAASKANPTRKKVVAERNEVGDTHLAKTPTSNSRPSTSDGLRDNDKIGSSIDDLSSKGKSVCCKSNLTRKRVLGERNEAGDTHLVRTLSLGPRSSSRDAFGENENIGDLTDDPSSKGRDSLSKFSSPRHQFLRYKPDRRREMLLRKENEVKEGRKEAITRFESGMASIDDLTSDDYDPVRNYLSPRPKFLYYNPNKSREILLRTEDEDEEGQNEGISSLEAANGSDHDGDLGDKAGESDGISSLEAASGVEIPLRTGNEFKEGENDEINHLEADNGSVDGGYLGDNGSVGEEGIDKSEKEVGEVSESDKKVVKLDESDRENELKEEGRDRTSNVEADNGNVSESDVESDGEMEEFDENEEKRGWGLKGASKFFLLSVVLVFCSSFISSMNSTTPSSVVVEFVNSLEKGSRLVEKQDTTEISYVDLNLPEEVVLVQDVEKAEIQSGENEALDVAEDGEPGVGLVGEESEEVVEIVEQEGMGEVDEGVVEFVNSLERGSRLVEKQDTTELSYVDLNLPEEVVLVQDVEKAEIQSGENEALDVAEDGEPGVGLVGEESEEVVEIVEQEGMGEVDELVCVLEQVDRESGNLNCLKVDEMGEVSPAVEDILVRLIKDVEVLGGTVDIDAVEGQDIQQPGATDGLESENILLFKLVKEEMVVDTEVGRVGDINNAGSEILSSEAEGIPMDVLERPVEIEAVGGHDMQLPSATDGMKSKSLMVDTPEICHSEVEGMSGEVLERPVEIDAVDGQDIELPGATTDGMESESVVLTEPIKEEMVDTEVGRLGNIILGVSVFASTIGTMVWAVSFKCKRATKKETSPVVKTCPEKGNPALAVMEDRQQCEHFTTSANPKSWIDSIDKHSKDDIYQSPSVELLGEFVVGEMSTSLRSCSMKSRIIESEEVSSRSVSTGKRMRNHVQPAFSAISSTENKSMKGEDGSEVESTKKAASTSVRRSSRLWNAEESSEVDSMNTVATPLRRSSRLRNRGIVSP